MHSLVLRFAQRLFLWLSVAALSDAGGTAAYAGIYQRYQLWKFQQEAAELKVIKSAIVEKTVDLREGDPVGKLEVPRIGISVIVLQGMERGTLTPVWDTYREPRCPAPKAMSSLQRTGIRFSANWKAYCLAIAFKSKRYAEPTNTWSAPRKLLIRKTYRLWSPEPAGNSR